MKYLLFIQGEGRGHMMQALALQEKLIASGHEIVAAVIGVQPGRDIPSFFKDQLRAPLTAIESPGFVVDKTGKGIDMAASIIRSFRRLPHYISSVRKISRLVAATKPDALINCYEPLAGLYYRFARHKRPLFSLAHQFFLEHPAFLSCPAFSGNLKKVDYTIRFYNRLVAPRGTMRIALSFSEEPDRPEENLFICPPLIRQKITSLTPTINDFILIYILNAGYSEEIIAWSHLNPDTRIEAFWNKPGETDTIISPSLTFHQLDTERFRERLAACRAYASTAGFDSIAEASYLQKDILVIPTQGHVEQKYNSFDIVRTGLGATTDRFDLSAIAGKQKPAQSPEAKRRFKDWTDRYEQKIISLIENGSQPSA